MPGCELNCTPPVSPSVSPWSSVLSFLATPTGIAVGILAIAVVTALWLAASSWYESHALAADVTETVAPVGYGAYSSRRKDRRRKRR